MWDLDHNLYQHVNRIKYEDKLPTAEEIEEFKGMRYKRLRKAAQKVYGPMGISLRGYPYVNIAKEDY